MQYQTLAVPAQEQVVTEVFSGYDHNRRIADGAFYEMENLTADEYPLLCARPRRGAAASIPGNAIQGAAGMVVGILAYKALHAVPSIKKLSYI